MPIYRNQDVKAALTKAEAASPENKELLIESWRGLVKKEEALQAQRQTLLLGMHVPMHIVLMIIDQS
jgi:hypothetical protein